MTYADVVRQLGLVKVCFGGCSITVRDHRRGFLDPFGIVHWTERRVYKRGLRQFLLLVARRDREQNTADKYGYLNTPRFRFYAIWSDEGYASQMAATLGFRFPVEFSRRERLNCITAASRAHIALTKWPAIYEWARRAL